MPLDFIELKDQDEKLDFYSPIIITTESKIEQEPALVKKFMQATTRATSMRSLTRGSRPHLD